MYSRINSDDLTDYFANVKLEAEISSGQAKPPRSGEFLVARQMLTRDELLQALQLQDTTPGALLGDCIAELGFAHPVSVERVMESYRVRSLDKVLGDLELDSGDLE